MASASSRLLLLLALLLGFLRGAAQETPVEMASRLYAAGNFHEAVTEYKRFLFFHAERDEISSPVYRQMGLALREEGKTQEAIDALETAILTSGSDPDRDEARLDLAVTLLGSNQVSQAEFVLTKVEIFSPDPSIRRRALLFRGVCDLRQGRWRSAREAIAGYYSQAEGREKETGLQIEGVFSRYQRKHHRSPKLAKWLSTFVPGSGQIYAGAVWDGINAVAVNGLAIWLAASDLMSGHAISFALSSMTIFYRYWSGNRGNAKSAAERYNEALDARLLREVLQILKAGGA